MNLMLREVPYNRALIRHLEVSLSMGGSTLGQMVAGRVSRWNARGFVLVPQNVGEPLPPFNQGGAGVEGDIFAGLAELLFSQTQSTGKTIIVLHPLARRDDPLRFRLPVVPSFYQNSVVAVVDSEIASSLDVETALKVCFTAIGLATFVVPSGSLRRNGDELSDGDALCDAIETVAVGVFDNETFLICQREPN